VAFSTVANDTVVTGGTYSNGTAVFRNNTGTFNVTGFSTELEQLPHIGQLVLVHME
jgi:hypothetical protein